MHATLSLQLCLILFIIFWTVRDPQQSFLKHFPQVRFKHFDIWPPPHIVLESQFTLCLNLIYHAEDLTDWIVEPLGITVPWWLYNYNDRLVFNGRRRVRLMLPSSSSSIRETVARATSSCHVSHGRHQHFIRLTVSDNHSDQPTLSATVDSAALCWSFSTTYLY